MHNIFRSWRTSLMGVAGLLTGVSQFITLFQAGGLDAHTLALPVSLISGGLGLFFAKE